MAGPQSNARLRADAGSPTSGVIHLRTRLTADFTVIANTLAQRRGSAVTVGVAAYILSLPDGAPVSIAALCRHFTEGEILISRALRELEAAGYLERRRVRGPGGVIRTRTFFNDVPGDAPTGDVPRRGPLPRSGPAQPTPPARSGLVQPTPTRSAPPPAARTPETRSTRFTQSTRLAQPTAPAPGSVPAVPPERMDAPDPSLSPPAPEREPVGEREPALEREPAPESEPAPEQGPVPRTDPRALVILASLRIRDPRLILSRREVDRLAPAVSLWLARGVGQKEITDLLTTGLPDRFRARPARILAYRLDEPPVAAPPPSTVVPDAPAKPVVLPWQTCDGGCERAFRAAEPGCCRDCRVNHQSPAVASRHEPLSAAC
ncbi:hypothetical protein [Streptomyces sp. bgisy100]|uniref:hypothetical protein n=1 Tax=Streptomyces sp. bgisy100 TaxID=3413783 RepID=UPI003D749790